MGEGLFRKKSMERLNSPEALNDYIRVVNPGSWMMLGAALIFMTGICIWGIFGRITEKVVVPVVSDGTGVYCLIREEIWENLNDTAGVTVKDTFYDMDRQQAEVVVVDDRIDAYAKEVGSLLDGERAAAVRVEASLEEGTYSGEIIVESISPVSYILN